MLTINADNRFFSNPFLRVCFLAFTWVLGLAIGYSISEPYYFPMMRSAFFQPVSIVGLFVCIFLPLSLSYVFAFLEKPIFILIVCFIKSVAYGFSCGLISLYFKEASWLFCFLFLFSDSCFLLILLTFWLKTLPDGKRICIRTARFCSIVGILVAAADYCVVSPFLERLL